MKGKLTRSELEDQEKNSTGGTSPNHGDVKVYDKEAGWQFRPFEAVEQAIVDVEEHQEEQDEAIEGLRLPFFLADGSSSNIPLVME